MIFVFSAAVAAADVTLLQTRHFSWSTVIAALLGFSAILVTLRQNESRAYRLGIIKKIENKLQIRNLVGHENHITLSLGDTLLLLSIALFVIPTLSLFFALLRFL
jgi:hypothetical protein